MARNSYDGSYIRFVEVETIAKVYFEKSKYYKNNGKPKIEKPNDRMQAIGKIEKACNVLCEPYKTIIKNTFFEKKNLYWWETYYSKTTYYRLRNKAIKTFLLAYKLQ